MVRLCIIMQYTTLCSSCIIIMLVSHTCILAIGHAEQGPEETPELALVECVNLEQDQDKPGASNHHS
jgi:hypothetical protein